MMDAEKVLDVIGAQMRGAPPAGVDVAYVDGFLSRNRAGLAVQLRAGLDQLQILGAQQDRLQVWRADHRLLREALHLARQHTDPAWEARVAGWLLAHAEAEERALAGMWVHSSRASEAGQQRAHIIIEHRTLAATMRAVVDGSSRLTEQFHDEMDHHLREEEVALPYLRPASFPYASCGITQADLDAQQANIRASKDAARRVPERVPEPEASPHHALLAQMGLAALPPGVEVYLFRAAEPPTEDSTGRTARWGVRYQGAERGVFDEWLSIRPEMTLTADGHRAGVGDGSPWPAGVGMPLGQSRSYRGLMRFFVPEVYDRLLLPERPIPAPPARLVYQGKKDAVATLFYPGSFGMRQLVVRKAEIQAVGERLSLSYVREGERKVQEVHVSGDERDFVVLLDGRVEIPTAPYADRSGFIVQAMYDTSSRRRFIHRLREWLRWEPTVVLGWYWQGRSGYVDQWPSWATTPLLREMELAVEEAAPKVLSAMEGAGMDGWRTNLVKLRQMVQAIRGAAPRIGDDQVRDVLLARMRAAG